MLITTISGNNLNHRSPPHHLQLLLNFIKFTESLCQGWISKELSDPPLIGADIVVNSHLDLKERVGVRSVLGEESVAEHLLDSREKMLLSTDQEGKRVRHQAGQLRVERLHF